jgi:hypothetical protein
MKTKRAKTLSIRTLTLLTLLFAISAGMAYAAGPDLKEGEWRESYQMEVSGMPFPMPPITANKTMCLDRNNYIPDNTQPGQECKVSDQKVNGNTVTWTLHCRAQERTIEGHGKITYKGDHYDGMMDAKLISVDYESPAVGYKYTMQGQRLRACTK